MITLAFKRVKDTKNMVRFETEVPEGTNPLAFYLPKGLVAKLDDDSEMSNGATQSIEIDVKRTS